MLFKRIGRWLFTAACTLSVVACGGPTEPEQSAVPIIPTEASVAAAPAEDIEEEIESETAVAEAVATSTLVPIPPTATAPPSATPTRTLKEILPSQGLAPEINNETWINSDQPLRLEELRGQVVLIEFWTYG